MRIKYWVVDFQYVLDDYIYSLKERKYLNINNIYIDTHLILLITRECGNNNI